MFSCFITGSVKCRLWADCVPLFFTRVRKQWGYCCHVLICMVKTIVCSLRFTLTDVLLENGMSQDPQWLAPLAFVGVAMLLHKPIFFQLTGLESLQWPPYGLERWLPHHADKNFLTQITCKESDVFGEGGWVVCIWKNVHTSGRVLTYDSPAWILNIWMQQFSKSELYFSSLEQSLVISFSWKW